MGPLVPYTRPKFGGAQLNFRLIVKFGAAVGWALRAGCPPLPPLGGLDSNSKYNSVSGYASITTFLSFFLFAASLKYLAPLSLI